MCHLQVQTQSSWPFSHSSTCDVVGIQTYYKHVCVHDAQSTLLKKIADWPDSNFDSSRDVFHKSSNTQPLLIRERILQEPSDGRDTAIVYWRRIGRFRKHLHWRVVHRVEARAQSREAGRCCSEH